MKCWAFSPPGGVADPHVAEAAQDFCTSVVLGKDWIPRLTVGSFARLRDEMVSCVAHCTNVMAAAIRLKVLSVQFW